MIPYQSIQTELTNMAASQAAISVSGTLQKLTPAQMAALASGLGRKNGIRVVFDNYSTACTDGKTIVLPLTSKDSSWIIRGYLDHELGHVRYSDLDLAPRKPPFERSLWNIIEDVRIEKALGDAYPGMATNLSTLVSELLRTKVGVFEVPPGSPPEAVLCGYVGLTLRTLYLKQHMLADLALNARDQFLITFSPELERDLFEIVTQIGSVEDTAGVVDMVRQIVALLEKHRDAADSYDPDSSDDPQQSQPSPDDQESQNTPGQSQTSPDDQDDQDNSGSSEHSPDTPDNQDNSDQPDSHKQSQDNSDQPANTNDPSQSQQSHTDPDQHNQSPADQELSESGPVSNNQSTQADQQGGQDDADPSVHNSDDSADMDDLPADTEANKQASDQDSSSQAPHDAPLGLTPPQSDPTPLKDAITQALESDLEISDFGQQLRELARESESALGIDPRSFQMAIAAPKHLLPSYAYSEQPIKASSAIVAKLSAELKALLQAQALARNNPSSSGNRIARSRLHRIRTGEAKLFLRNSTVKQVNTAIHLLVDISGSMAGRRLLTTRDVVFALIKTLAHQRGINLAVTLFPGYYPYNSTPSGDPNYPVAALLPHGQKPANKLFWPVTARGCTPLAESLRYVLSTMVHLPETRKLVILLTDGDPNDDRTARLALDEAQSLGIEVAALGIEGLSNTALFPVCEVVDRVEHLPQKAFKLLESLLTPNKE